mmetsp:Transcript_3786/g.9050  ORF Transcript_3786/g.9050 Transcript_3786/m.9050 type:complete len:87 (-) Transcript_3786:859-1119(-)
MSTDDFERLVFEEGKHRRAASDDELFNDCAEDEPPSEEALGAGGSAAPITGVADDTVTLLLRGLHQPPARFQVDNQRERRPARLLL